QPGRQALCNAVVFSPCTAGRIGHPESWHRKWRGTLAEEPRFQQQKAARFCEAAFLLLWGYCIFRSGGTTKAAFSSSIAIPSITSRAISSQKFPTGVSACFLRV